MSTVGSHTRKIATLLTTTALIAVPLATLGTPMATAAGRTWKLEATGLNNPRDLVWTKSTLYVAEAGTGGSGPCLTGAEGVVCFGSTGSMARVKNGHVTRVITGLPSLAGAGGSSAIGPADLVLGPGRRYVLTIGLGNDPAVRSQLPAGASMGTVVKGHASVPWGTAPKGPSSKAPAVVADLAAYEQANNPDGGMIDTNPNGMLLDRGGWTVADSGGNSVVKVRPDGSASTLAVFGSPGSAPAPFPPFDMIPMESVPTSVARGSDGAYYVSEFTGFPFAQGASRIIRVTKDGRQSVWATGLTNVTDLEWFEGNLYAVQLATNGLLSAGEGLPMGSLVKVSHGSAPTVIAGDLPAPYGLTFGRSKAWVTTCSVCAGGGSIVSIPLP